MNATIKTATYSNVTTYSSVATYGSVVGSKVKKEELVFALPDISILTLVLILLFSALVLVYVKDLNRQLFSSSEQLKQNYTQLQMAHDQLLLERSVWGAQSRVQQVAEKLDLQLPSAKETVTIKL